MSYLVFARKYRPLNFEEIVEQSHVVQTLKNSISSKRIAHSILFAGPRGTGKTTVARVLAKALNCEEGTSPTPCGKCSSCLAIAKGEDVDVIEIDGASNNSVDQIREIRENIRYMPVKSVYKIYIIDEVHMLTTSAFNALLKTLEEPPPHVKFFFATTEINKIPITIISRCQRYDLRRITINGIFTHIKSICDKEKIEIEDKALKLIAKEADGSLRDSLSILDQMLNLSSENISYDEVLETLGLINTKVTVEITNAIFNKDVLKVLSIIEEAYYKGYSLKNLFKAFVEHIRALLIIKTIEEKSSFFLNIPPEEIKSLKDSILEVSKYELQEMLDTLFKEEANIKFSMHEKFALEALFIKLSQIRKKVSIDSLIEKIDLLSKRVQDGKIDYSKEVIEEKKKEPKEQSISIKEEDVGVEPYKGDYNKDKEKEKENYDKEFEKVVSIENNPFVKKIKNVFSAEKV